MRWVMIAILVVVGSASAQTPSGYWLYVGGIWQAGFVRQAECEGAGAKLGKAYECRPVGATTGQPSPGGGGWTTLQSTKAPVDRWAKDVKECELASGVEAVASGSSVRFLGTSRQRFDFSRCLIERGHKLD